MLAQQTASHPQMQAVQEPSHNMMWLLRARALQCNVVSCTRKSSGMKLRTQCACRTSKFQAGQVAVSISPIRYCYGYGLFCRDILVVPSSCVALAPPRLYCRWGATTRLDKTCPACSKAAEKQISISVEAAENNLAKRVRRQPVFAEGI